MCAGIAFAILCISFGWRLPVCAQEFPLEITAQYLEEEEYVLVKVLAREAVNIQAFTFSVTYDTDGLELYKGNDLLPGGYGYAQTFEENYKKDGMLFSNQAEKQFLFSGVSQSESGYQGVIAEISLLVYKPEAVESARFTLDITTWYVDGQPITLDEENRQITCMIGEYAAAANVGEDTEMSAQQQASEYSETGARQTDASAGETVAQNDTGQANILDDSTMETESARLQSGVLSPNAESAGNSTVEQTEQFEDSGQETDEQLKEDEDTKDASVERKQIHKGGRSVWILYTISGLLLVFLIFKCIKLYKNKQERKDDAK